ncbi:peptidylprolyl isomerase [Caulobacter sp. S45]|uniref:peptidylprolyl isomerase n=1 Tax=Caulobacter sp. S45 TaxID=1641861 RepID=UPI00131BDDF5|nr:peptidylprolyl isomerase [Caulobacter sp. S45]
MLSQFRALAKSPVAKVLIFLVMASVLATFALRGVNSVVQGDNVIQAGSRSVSSARFKQMFDDELKQYNQQSGQTITAQDALAHGVDRQVADSIAADEAFAEFLTRSGVRPSDKLIVDEIRKAPRFFNAVSGRFDRQAYEQFVQQIGMTDAEFEGVLRDQLAQTQFVSGVAAGMRAPLLYSALQAAYTAEGRTFSYFVLGPNAVPLPAQPTDVQLNTFIKQNAQALARPEARVFTLVRFSTAQQVLKTTADPAAVQKRFDFEKDSLSTPEKRTVIEIPVHDAASAGAVAARLKKGEDATLIAKSLNVQPLNYNDSPKTAIADRKIADVAFAMADGDVKGPVQGDLGLAVLKLVKTTPGHNATLEEQRAKLEAEVKHDAAQATIDKQVQKYEDTRSGGSTMLQAAKALGVETATLPGVTAQGMSLTAQPQRIPLPPKLLQAGFALAAGADTDLVDLGQGEYAALHLEKIVPPAPPPLDEIRPMLTRYYMQRDLTTRLQAKADAIVAQVKKGQTMEAAAAGAGATLGHGVGVQRQAAGQTFSNELLSRVFQAKPGEVVSGPDVKKVGVLVAKVQGPVAASGKDVSQSAANLRRGASQSVVQDLAAALRTAARDIVKPKIDYKRARAALGGAPSQGQ